MSREKNDAELAGYILDEVGGHTNVSSFTHCMTRLRITLNNHNLADIPALKQLSGVIGVVSADDSVQIILGTGKVNRVHAAFGKALKEQGGAHVTPAGAAAASAAAEMGAPGTEGAAGPDIDAIADQTRTEIKKKQSSSIQHGLRHIGNIFIPLIPGFVGSGLVVGITSVMTNMAKSGSLDPAVVEGDWFRILAATGNLLLGTLGVFVGINAAKEFGGTEVLGGIAGLLVYSPIFLLKDDGGVAPLDVFGIEFSIRPGLGGVLGVILSVWVWVQIEKWARSWAPEALDLLVVPLVTMLLGLVFTVLVVMPISGLLMDGITWFLVDFALNTLGILGGYILAATFLPLVTVGLHQGLTPVHLELIADHGYTELLPVLAGGGAGMFGAAIAIYVKTKDHGLRKRIIGAAPVGFLGIGEPLIYGVVLPLGRPFITACLGAGFAGAWMSYQGVGAIAVGLSGEALIPLIYDARYLTYIAGLFIGYIAGFILTYFFGFKEEMVERLYEDA